MRLQKHINEIMNPAKIKENDKLLKDLAVQIRRRGREWITTVKKCKYNVIWRGVESSDDWVLKRIRKNREPLDTSDEKQKEYDEYFNKKFGWKPRSGGLFVKGSLSGVTGYGRYEYVVIPIKYKNMLWSPKVADLYAKRSKWDKIKDTYTNKNLCKAIMTDKEIMINADLYYGIKADVFGESSYNTTASKFEVGIQDGAENWMKQEIFK